MKQRNIILLLVFSMITSIFLAMPTLAEDAGDEAPTGPVTYDMPYEFDDVKTYSYLECWNGGAGAFPIGFEDGPVAKAIEERTGARVEVETIVSSEQEKLSTIFMSGTIPDITNAPHWETTGGSGELIKEAGVDGLLLDLSEYIPQFPNIERMMTAGISQVYIDRDIHNPAYEGAVYVIPTETGRTREDNQNWAYNIWVRADILEDLGYEQADINTQDKLYDFLVEIRDGGFTDINGQPVIPAGSWHNGWSYSSLLSGFGNHSVSSFYIDDDGKIQSKLFADWQEDSLLYMKKLCDENLFDKESFTQTDSVARQKAATGRCATITGHYPHQHEFFSANLTNEHPEMRYIPIGPIQNDEGETPCSWMRDGRTGSPVLFFNADIEEPERALNWVDFINSDEGLLLAQFGIEGTHYNWVDGIPTLTEEWQEIKTTDANRYYLEGFGWQVHTIGANPMKTWGWDAAYNEEGYVEAREFNPVKYFEGITLDELAATWEGLEGFEESMATIDWDDEQEKAYLSSSDEEALSFLENYRQRMLDAGLEEMLAFMQEEYDANPDAYVE